MILLAFLYCCLVTDTANAISADSFNQLIMDDLAARSTGKVGNSLLRSYMILNMNINWVIKSPNASQHGSI